jgi:hypothetical protein
MLATVTRVAVWAFTIVVAVNQLGIATTLINTLLIGVVGAFTIAFGLAFGLGGRDKAAQLLERIGREAERAGPKLERAATAAGQQAKGTAQQAQGVGHHSPGPMGNGNWVERSEGDRRRVERPGPRDRRMGGESAS